MGSGSIGIKLADNKFFPIMGDGVQGSKTLELTTVRENQDNVQIHLYRSKDGSMDRTIDSAEYIGTLTIRDIAERQAGYPTIKLKIAIDDKGDLSAEAIDADSGARQSLNISLGNLPKEALETHQDFDITGVESEDADLPDFDDIGLGDMGIKIEDYRDAKNGGGIDFSSEFFEETPLNAPAPNSFREAAGFTESLAAPYASNFDSGFVESKPIEVFLPGDTSDSGERAKRRKMPFFPLWLCILILVLGIAVLIGSSVFAWRFFYARSMVQRPMEEVLIVSEPAPAPAQPVPVEEPTPPPVWEESPAVVVAPPEPPRILEAPPPTATQAAHYLVKWGDNLWNIAEAYYRDPWKYPRIAQHNGIDNPHLIIAGTYIEIPAE